MAEFDSSPSIIVDPWEKKCTGVAVLGVDVAEGMAGSKIDDDRYITQGFKAKGMEIAAFRRQAVDGEEIKLTEGSDHSHLVM